MAQSLDGSPQGAPPFPIPLPPGSSGFSVEQKEYLEGFLRALAPPETSAQTPEKPRDFSLEKPLLPASPQQAWLDAGKRLSKEEQIKLESNPLDYWNTIEDLSSRNRLPEGADIFRLKFHGLFKVSRSVSKTQDSIMCRLRIPGGALSAFQLKVIADCAERYGRGGADITTRANFQIREIPARHMADLLMDLHEAAIIPRGAGADNIRNITGSPTGGIDSDELIDVLPLCRKLHHHILNNRELYGLPRKFNIAFDGGGSVSSLEDTNDIGFRAVRMETGHDLAGIQKGVYFRVALGGITGHRDFARDAGLLIKPEECLSVAAAIIKVFITHGDRGNRKKARLKYVLDQKGVPWFLQEIQKLLPFPLRFFPIEGCRFAPLSDRRKHLGAHPQKQAGRFWIGVDVPVGRLTVTQMRGLAELAARFGSGSIRLTVWQNLLLTDIPKGHLQDCFDGLKELGLSHELDPVSAGLVACTGSEGCQFGQAATKSTALAVLNHLRRARSEGRLVLDHPVNIHLTGCPHSCAQHFIGDIGLLATSTERTGQSIPAFHFFIGGGFQDKARMAVPALREIPVEEVPLTVERILRFYLDNRMRGESFTDFTRHQSDAELETLFGLAATTTPTTATVTA
jgi:ferredoxin-nitrite reductase